MWDVELRVERWGMISDGSVRWVTGCRGGEGFFGRAEPWREFLAAERGGVDGSGQGT